VGLLIFQRFVARECLFDGAVADGEHHRRDEQRHQQLDQREPAMPSHC